MYTFLLFVGFIISFHNLKQYSPGTQEKYKSRLPVMKDGMKIGLTERQGGGNGGAEADVLWSKNRFGEGFGPHDPSNRSESEIIAHITELFRKKAILDILENENISIETRAVRAKQYLEEDESGGMVPNITKGGLFKDWGDIPRY